MSRSIIQVVEGRATQDGAGVKLARVIGQSALPRLDPFLMLDEFGSDEAQDYIAGFPEHPHRGFQTVTYMLDGKMEHRDSVGNRGVIEPGGAQWMNAGKGIIHSEMPQQTEGKLRGFQLWINLPAEQKFSSPNYQDLSAEQIPEVKLSADTRLRVIAGEYNGVKGAVTTQAVEPSFFDIISAESGSVEFGLDDQFNCFIYVYEGEVNTGEARLRKGQLGVFGKGDALSMTWDEGCQFILVAAKPINEPIVQYGPFVMNTQAQIHEAIRDYQAGRLA